MKYRIFYSVPYVLEVEAENEEQALDIANETDLSEFMHDTTCGDYEIELVETQNQTQTK